MLHFRSKGRIGSRSAFEYYVGWLSDMERREEPLLLHRLAPTAPENAEGTCSTRHSNFGRRSLRDINGSIMMACK